jgi:hypothetical protein
MRHFYFLLPVLFCLSCQPDKDVSSDDLQQYGKVIELTQIDSTLVDLGYTYNYDNFNGLIHQEYPNERVTHVSNGQIFSFDPASGKVIDFFEIKSEGPGSVSPRSGFDGVIAAPNDQYLWALNMGSNFVIADQTKSEVLFNIFKLETRYTGHCTQNKPFTADGKRFFFNIYGNPSEEVAGTASFLVYEPEEKYEYDLAINYPTEYDKGFYGGTPYLYWPSIQFNKQRKEFIVSYPISNYIDVYDEDLRHKKRILMNSPRFTEIQPLSEKIFSEEDYPGEAKDREYYGALAYYFSLYVDNANGYIYRQVKVPNEDAFFGYDYYLLVADINYQPIGEWKIPETHHPFNIYCDQKGLNIYDVSALGNTESGVATFTTFKPE